MDVLHNTVNGELYGEKTDEELVLETQKRGDVYALLIERYQKRLERYIKRISSFSEEDREEILQETFIKAYKNLNGFDTSLKFSSWIYRIAHNETVSYARKIKAIPFSSFLTKNNEGKEEPESLVEKIAADIDTEREFDKKIIRDHIAEALETLDKKYRDVLILRFLEEKDYEEISDILQKPIGTVSVLIRRAKEKFKNIVVEKNIHKEL